ncbi:MAG TPA: alpha/beta fold hydrolase [Herpetosiphonaceae bacterium]
MEQLGCLVLHGFKSSSNSVNRVPVRLARHGIPYRMPLLRGHGTRPEDLQGVTWHDWYADASAALDDLRREAKRIVIIGLSMGGLVSLHLTAANPQDVIGVATVGAAIRFCDRRAPYARFIAPFMPMVGNENHDRGQGWADPELGRRHNGYLRFPASAFVSLWRYARLVERQLPRVLAPLLIIHSRVDRTIPPEAATVIHRLAGSADKELVWFERSGHEMLRDSEADGVLDEIERFVLARRAALEAAPGLAAKE